MKLSYDFRKNARDALRGRWSIAVIAGIVAALLGGMNSYGIDFSFDPSFIFELGTKPAPEYGEVGTQTSGGIALILLGVLGAVLSVSLVFGIAMFILGSIINVGYSAFNLDLVDRRNTELSTLFSYFKNWKVCVLANLLQTVYILLWSLLLIIPGIIATYSYAMTPYILAENPNLSPKDALDRSKQMMIGNKWRLFCLDISFIGWTLLSILTLGIGTLWLNPYINVARADFYREISGTRVHSGYYDPMGDFNYTV